VHLLVRGPRLRASGAMQDRVRAHDKVTVHHSTQARTRQCPGRPARPAPAAGLWPRLAGVVSRLETGSPDGRSGSRA
jgi:hypothetical protein